MSRNSRRLRGMVKASAYGSSSSSSYQTQPRDPFGPQMACEVFGVNDYDDMEDCDVVDDSYGYETVEAEEYWYQTELPLENVREMEQRHLREIKKFDRAYRKMCQNALKWHYLMEDIEDNAQLKKMFNDIQLMRKLGGSEGV